MDKNSSKTKYCSYEEASAWAKSEGIETGAQWDANKSRRPPSVPPSPRSTYKTEFKNGGWGRFLGTDRVATSKRIFVSYEEASAWAQSEGIKSYNQWLKRCKLGVPEHIPADPRKIYKNEFKDGGWGRFFGTGRVANLCRQFMSYEECSLWAQKEGITGDSDWRKRRQKGLPADVPSDPGTAYACFYEKGGLPAFLGLKTQPGTSKIERCLRYVLEQAIEGEARSSKPSNLRGASGQIWAVDIVLQKINLVIEYDGSHYHNKKEDVDLRKTHDLRAAGYQVVRVRCWDQKYSLKLLCDKWDVLIQDNKNKNIKSQISIVIDHLLVLSEKNLLSLSVEMRHCLMSWRDVDLEKINFREVLTNYDQFLSYQEASFWAQSEGIVTKNQWIQRCKNGLPSNIPRGPHRVYEEFKDGGWGKFLGTGQVWRRHRRFVSYEEASAWAQQEGIENSTQWRKRCAKDFPADIPKSPSSTYLEKFKDGGWGRFLGNRRASLKNGK